MVCNRYITSVKARLKQLGFKNTKVTLGEVCNLPKNSAKNRIQLIRRGKLH